MLKLTDDMKRAIRVTAVQAVRNCMMPDPTKEMTSIQEGIVNRIVEDVVKTGIPAATPIF